MPNGAVAHRNVPRQRALFPLRQRPNRRQTPRVSVGGLAVFFVPVRAVEGKTPVRAVGLARFCARVYNKKQKMPPNE